MENLKHTKGEWIYQVTKKNDIGVKMPNGNFLHLGYISSDDCGLPTCCKTEEHANAKLIASAPELLEALIEMREYYVYCKNMEEYEYERLLDKIDNAINKATK